MNTSWFVIVNPKAGNKSFKKKWGLIQDELHRQKINFELAFTKYHKHEIDLVHQAISKGYKKLIAVGGDGTLHHIVNGVMTQKSIPTTAVTIGIIPIGTGNDWVKTYKIPSDIKDAVTVIKKGKSILQDIGFLELTNTTSFFNNVAGIGYDGYVVNKLDKLKKFGSIAYLISGIAGLLLYKKTPFELHIDNEIYTDKCLMTLFGICKYSAGGMQLTDYKDSTNGLFDITFAKNLSFFNLLFAIKKLYNGKIVKHKKVTTFLNNTITVHPLSKKEPIYIQADGELIGTGKVKVTLIPKALGFVIS